VGGEQALDEVLCHRLGPSETRSPGSSCASRPSTAIGDATVAAHRPSMFLLFESRGAGPGRCACCRTVAGSGGGVEQVGQARRVGRSAGRVRRRRHVA